MRVTHQQQKHMMPTYHPTVRIFEKKEEVSRYAAESVVELIKQKKDAHMIVPTGTTAMAFYENLVHAYNQKLVDFSQVSLWNLDEYWPLNPMHDASYASFMRKHLINHVNIDAKHWHIPNSGAKDPEKEAARYAKELLACKEIDLAILGIGPGKTCHIGFNEIGSTYASSVRYVHVSDETAKVNMKLFNDPTEFPQGAITQGVSDILRAKKIILLANGEAKAWGVWRSLMGEIGSDAPASFLRYHRDVTFILDKEAASLLS